MIGISSDMDEDLSPSLARGIIPTADYTSHPPSPPPVYIPPLKPEQKASLSIVPSFDKIDSSLLTKEEFEIITGGETCTATDSSHEWRYDSRRTAHLVLDFLYLGPISMIRNEDFLKSEGITMVLCVLDSRMSATFAAHQRRAHAQGIAAGQVFIESRTDLIRTFEPAVRMINDHLLSVYRGQAVQGGGEGAKFRKGKVLVCCETGNDRSASVCAAYLMAIFGESHVQAVQFVLLKRLSSNFDEDSKWALRSFDDILMARRDVQSMSMGRAGHFSGHGSHGKRQFEDTMDISDDETLSDLDRERSAGRGFAPFHDATGF